MDSLQQQVSANLERYRAERQKFIALIQVQEKLAAKNPDGYRRKVVAYAWLGYLYVLAMLGLLLLCLGGLIYLLFNTRGGKTLEIKFAIVLLPVIFVVVRSLFVKIGAPEGPRMSRTEAPKLWAEVDQLAASLGAPKVHEIIFEMDMNAAAAQVPRFGLLGFYRNYLLIGLPLMMTLPPDEMKSVIAHEFGHFSGQHGRTGGWIYKLNETFGRIRSSLAQSGSSFLFSPFFNWFQPRFDAVSFALRRQNEYAADAAAAKMAGSRAAGTSLMRLSFLAPLMDPAIWDRIDERTKTQREVPRDAFLGLEKNLAEEASRVDATKYLKRRLDSQTSYDDTHPSLTDRLNALKEYPSETVESLASRLTAPIGKSAAEEYLGPALDNLLGKFNLDFQTTWQANWCEIYDRHQKKIKDLNDLEAKQETLPLTPREEVDLAFLTLRFKDASLALPMFQRLVEARKREAEVNYGLGEAMLELGDPEGEKYLKESYRLDTEYLQGATQLIATFKSKHGEAEDLEKLQEEYLENVQVARVIEREKHTFRIGDEMVAVELSADEKAKLREQLRAHKDVKRAWLVTKLIPFEHGHKVHVLLIEPPKALLTDNDRNSKVVDRLIKELEFPTLIMVYAPQNAKEWANRMKQIPGSLLVEN